MRRLKQHLLWTLWPLSAIFERSWLENLFTALFMSRKSLISSKRIDVIKMIVKLPPHDARVLEIGTYFAEGSTRILVDELSNQANLFVMDT